MTRFDFVARQRSLVATGNVMPVVPDSWTGQDIANAVDRVLNTTVEGHEDAPTVVVGVIPFDTRRPAYLYRPARVVRQENPGPGQGGDVAFPLEVAEQHPDPDGYREIVGRAVASIGSSALDKVVLGRCVTVDSPREPCADEVFARLRRGNPDAYVSRVELGGCFEEPGVLLGASPELVLSCTGSLVETLPLAGTTPRGVDPVADQAAAQALLRSRKDLTEHSHVVQAVAEAFGRHADDVELPERPQLVATPVVWHLGTPVRGRLKPGHSPLHLLYDLHPTPAVCGWPSAEARDFIARNEGFDRGVFAGLVGWVDARGDCEWALVLRAGLLQGHRATMFAGAGIVAASDPRLELLETAAKMKTFVSALGVLGRTPESLPPTRGRTPSDDPPTTPKEK
ncbi:MAG: isochorismate synthase [Propionibacteriaceae bacterium]|nr:isochorismate synthase [Propionibacteriaceae bacterium]